MGSHCIRLLYGGICNTDIELQRGYYGFRGTPGHEFVGEVVEADDRSWIGERVVGEINLACGKCEWCARGLAGIVLNERYWALSNSPERFANSLTLPEANLRRVPREIPSEEAVFIEPLAAACEVLDQVRIPPGAPVAVLGDGKLGLLASQVLQAHGAHVDQYGRHQEKLRIAEQVGVSTENREEAAGGENTNSSVEATGSSEGLRQAVQMTQPRGTVIMKSTVHGMVSIDSAPVIVNEITLVGSRCGRFEPAIRLLKEPKGSRGCDDIEGAPVKNAPQAFKEAAKPGVLKVLLHD